MAKETKFITVEPSETENTIDLWQNFGWVLIGVPQEILSQTSGTSHLERRGDSIYSVRNAGTTIHYVRITFQRDKNMPNYAELVRLEKAYHTESNLPSQPFKLSSFSIFYGIIPLIIGFLCMCHYHVGYRVGIGVLLVGGVFAVVGVVLVIFRAVDDANKASVFKSKYSAWESACATIKREHWNKKQEILKTVESLLT
ncbi:MAG: hypothetical protein LBC59_07565 [Chitinispirillales bacterium]|jgi:hypothetical protein|nr:hypothetical protein [Chitinispirillales bacterium]